MNQRRTNAARAAKRFGLFTREADFRDEQHDYGIDFAAAMEEHTPLPRWLAIIQSDEFGVNFAQMHARKADALADIANTMDDPYGKLAVALVDLNSGRVWTQFAVATSGDSEIL